MTTHEPDRPLTASQRLALALGRPLPEPMSEQEIREFEAREDEVDAAISHRYGVDQGHPDAA